MSTKGRKPINIPPAIKNQRKENLKRVIIETGYDGKQWAFAKTILKCSKEHLSAVINGHKNLTESAAQTIHDKFPEYSMDYLLGYTKTKNGLSQDDTREISNAVNARFNNWEAAENLLFWHGYRVTDGEESEIIITAQNGKKKHMKSKDYLSLLNTINDLVEGYLQIQFQLDETTKRAYWR